MNVEILLQLQSSFQDADGVVRLLFQLQTPRVGAGKRNVSVFMLKTVLAAHAKEVCLISEACV